MCTPFAPAAQTHIARRSHHTWSYICSTGRVTGEARNADRVPMHQSALSLPPGAIGEPVRPLEPPSPVRVWIVRPRVGWAQLDGVANAYTPLAGQVRFVDEHGREDQAWVWANAISRR